MASLQAKADSVRHAISTTTFTQTTVSLLGDLLSSDAPRPNKSTNVNRERSKYNLVQSGSSVLKHRPLTSDKPVDVCQGLQEQLSGKDRSTLATEVVNAVLKTLTDAIQTRTSNARQSPSNDVTKASTRKTIRRSTSMPQTPLQPRSLQRISSSPNISSRLSRSSSAASITHSGYRCAAECARIAFAHLRSSNCPKAVDPASSPYHVENAMSVFIGKMVALGLDELAIKELKVLKRRIEIKPLEKSRMDGKSTVAKTPGLGELLDFGHPSSANSNQLGLMIASQMHVLRLLNIKRNRKHLETAIPILQPSHPSSPSKLVDLSAHDPKQLGKAIRQIQASSDLLLSLTPNISPSEDPVAGEARLSVVPDVAFQLQSLALQYRFHWWKLAGHQGDLSRDVLDPLFRAMSAFARRSGDKATNVYSLASSIFAEVRAMLPKQTGSDRPTRAILARINRLLSSLSQAASLYEDSIHWTEQARACSDVVEDPDASHHAMLARLAMLTLRTNPQSSKIEELLLALSEGMKRSFSGEASAIEDFLVEVSSFRRVATVLLSEQKPSSADPKGGLPEGTRQMCETLILQCPRLFMRYLGKAPGPNAPAKDIIRYEQRVAFASKPGYHAIDSALFLVKISFNEGRSIWSSVDFVLQDCLTLLDRIEIGVEANKLPQGTSASLPYYARVSHLYFTCYHNARRDIQDVKDAHLLRIIRRSIECLRSRPREERKAAMLSKKLEKLAELCNATGRYEELISTLVSLRNELIDYGVLHVVVTASSSQSNRAAWNTNDDALTLARTIGDHVKVRSRHPEIVAQADFVEERWSLEEKGTVLEHILDVLSNQPFSTYPSNIIALRDKVFQDLMSQYNHEYPLRRLRVQARYLSINRKIPEELFELIETDVITLLTSNIEFTRDTGLRHFLGHLLALTKNLMEFQRAQPSLDILKGNLGFWFSVSKQCCSLPALENQVDDHSILLAHLRFVANYLDVKGLGSTRTATLRLIAEIAELRNGSRADHESILGYTDLGAQWLQLGYTGKAAQALHKAQNHSQGNSGSSASGSVQLALTYADYFIAVGDFEKSEESLLKAEKIFNHEEHFSSNSTLSMQKRIDRYQMLAAASMVYSLLAFQRGVTQSGIVRAREAIKMLRKAWALLEERLRRDISSDDPFQPSESVIMINMPNDTDVQLSGACFWPLVAPLFRSLAHLSTLYAHQGMFQETLYYAEQGQKLAREVGSNAFLTVASSILGNIWFRAGRLDKASVSLKDAQDNLCFGDESWNKAILSCFAGQLSGALGDPHAEITAYDDSGALLHVLSGCDFINAIDQIKDAADAIGEKMASLAISKRQGKASQKTTRPRTATTKESTTSRSRTPIVNHHNNRQECCHLDSLRVKVLHQKANALMLQKRHAEAATVFQEANGICSSQIDSIYQVLGSAKHLLFQSMELMNADPVYSVLYDSTISFPSIVGQARNDKSVTDRLSLSRLSPSEESQLGKSSRVRTASKIPAIYSFFDKLRQAQEKLMEVSLRAVSSAPLAAVHRLSALLSSVAILLSAADSGKAKSIAFPGFASCFSETARTTSLRRERKAILSDAASKLNTGHDEWPSLPAPDSSRDNLDNCLNDMSTFQQEYIDIIPKSWTAISIFLSDSHDELTITKWQAGCSPFILRLPLGRNNSRDADEDVFGFDQGKSELYNIIDMANESAHSARDISGREAKVVWWETRVCLDARLRDLLENIQRIWLGGFTGVFSQHTQRPDLLSRFQKSFHNILDKYLPSRQKTKKKKKSVCSRVTLDSRIMDLFTGLGDAAPEKYDLSEPLNDLLYFVVDVLQFHGELNAYAEIDFDSMVIETQDALRCYHEAAKACRVLDESKHTILILDKTLHAFPWESLPCMDGLAVSRVPSLGCLRDRIIDQENATMRDGQEGHYLDCNSGSYILNPSGDLQHTQATFQTCLQSVANWDGIVQREPSEDEMKLNLESKDIVLYFGHGSGAQYIRAREIRKLKKCAVTMLMGCSSGALTDAGEFEAYGPPVHYMHAGCPAVVATLWDVTDKDIDRFAMHTLQQWGLLKSNPDNTDHVMGRGRRSKRAETKVEIEVEAKDASRKVSLVEAVAKGRHACNLRYLNAAAVCVYGVPVYLR